MPSSCKHQLQSSMESDYPEENCIKLEYIRGIGPLTIRQLNKLKIHSYNDLQEFAKTMSQFSYCNWLKEKVGVSDKQIALLNFNMQFIKQTSQRKTIVQDLKRKSRSLVKPQFKGKQNKRVKYSNSITSYKNNAKNTNLDESDISSTRVNSIESKVHNDSRDVNVFNEQYKGDASVNENNKKVNLTSVSKITGNITKSINKSKKTKIENNNETDILEIENIDKTKSQDMEKGIKKYNSKKSKTPCRTSRISQTKSTRRKNVPRVKKCNSDTDKQTLIIEVIEEIIPSEEIVLFVE